MISRNKKPKNYIDVRENRSPSDHIVIKYLKRGFTAKAIFVPAMILFFLSGRAIVESLLYESTSKDHLWSAYTYFFIIFAMLIYMIRSRTAFMDETKEGYAYIIIVNILGVLLGTYIITLSTINHSYFLALLFAIWMYRLSYFNAQQRLSMKYFKVNNYLLLGITSMLYLSYLKGLN